MRPYTFAHAIDDGQDALLAGQPAGVQNSYAIYAGDRVKLELMAESFNLLNRDNKRVQITQDGFISNAAQFVQTDKAIGINIFTAKSRVSSSFLHATDAYAPRQIQLALKPLF